MLAIRRAAAPIRFCSYRFQAPLVSYGKSERQSDTTHSTLNIQSFFSLDTKGFLPQPSSLQLVPGKSQIRSLSSFLKPQNSFEEDHKEDEISKLETQIGEEEIMDQDSEEIPYNPRISDDDDDDDASETSSDINSNDVKMTKRNGSTNLFRIIYDTHEKVMSNALNKWVENGHDLERLIITETMKKLQSRKMYRKALLLSKWLEENKHFTFEEQDYAFRLEIIAKLHGIVKAEKYMGEIPKSLRRELIYRTLLINCTSTLHVKKCEEIFEKIKDLGLTSHSCNQMIFLYNKVDPRKISDVLSLMEKENIMPDLSTYRTLIDMKGWAGDINGMEKIIEIMKAKDIHPDFFIQSLMAKHYIANGKKKEAEMILSQIDEEELNQKDEACRILLPLYASLGKSEDVTRIVESCMKTSSGLLKQVTAIEAWGKMGKIEEAEKVFDELQKRHKSSPMYYTSLLKVYADHKLLEKGRNLIKRMSDNQCPIDSWTLDALVKFYVETGELEKANSILHKAVQNKRIRPNFVTYLTILDKYSKKGDVYNAEKIFHGSREAGYAGRRNLYGILLQTYINANVPAFGFRERMKGDGVVLNRTISALLSQADAFKKTPVSELVA